MMNDDYPSIAELERVAAVGSGRDLERERREARDASAFADEIEELDAEAAADAVEEVLRGYENPLTGLPPAGLESPRFRSERERQYISWIHSEAGRRTRANVHPRLHERLERERADGFARRDAEAGRSVESR